MESVVLLASFWNVFVRGKANLDLFKVIYFTDWDTMGFITIFHHHLRS